jgi:hypothetical protein
MMETALSAEGLRAGYGGPIEESKVLVDKAVVKSNIED